MLLPSALACDGPSHHPPPLTRLQASLFASPPASPPQLSSQHAIGNIFSACHSLQSLLGAPAPIGDEPITPPHSSHANTHAQLPTPPMIHAPSPLKLRLRSRKTDGGATSGNEPGPVRKRIVKRSLPVTRGANKRRRAVEDDLGRGDEESETEEPGVVEEEEEMARPQTPKRARVAPERLPLGLERSDFHDLHLDRGVFQDDEQRFEGTDVVVEADGETWSTEEDRILVELVLEKLKLSKSEWQDCARNLGKDRGSVGRRWKSLMVNGDIGLKRGGRRGRIHGTWR